MDCLDCGNLCDKIVKDNKKRKRLRETEPLTGQENETDFVS